MKRTTALGLLVSGGVVTAACNAIFGLEEGQVDPTFCASAADCDDGDHCTLDSCESRHCVSLPAPALPIPDSAQEPGDCRRLRCDLNGEEESITDDEDLPNDGLECTEDLCISGVPIQNILHQELCSGGRCDDTGACVECLSQADCPGANDPPVNACRSYLCEAGECTPVYQPAGSP